MKIKRIAATTASIAGASAAGLLLGVGANLAYASPGAPSGQVSHQVPVDADYDLQILDQPFTAADALPDQLDVANVAGGLNASSARLVQEDGDSSSYVVKNELGELCLVVFLDGENWVSGTACASPENFASSGISLLVEAPPIGVAEENYLVPDSDVVSLADVEELQPGTSPNLLVADPFMSSEERRDLIDATDGTVLEVVVRDEG